MFANQKGVLDSKREVFKTKNDIIIGFKNIFKKKIK